MTEIFDVKMWQEIIVGSLTQLGGDLAAFIPKLLGMIVILLVGWILARILQAAAGRVLERAGLDRAAERLGVSETLQEAGLVRAPSGVIARLLFWLLMLTFVLSAVETLGLSAVTSTIDRLIAYLPNVIAASLIVVLGLLLARFVGNLVASGAAAADMPYARALGSGARAAMIIMVTILSLEQLGVDAAALLYAMVIVASAIAIALSLSFANGSRDVVGAIVAGYYLRNSLGEGAHVEIDGRAGVLERVGPIDTLFNKGDDSWSIPNRRLLDAIIDRKRATPGS